MKGKLRLIEGSNGDLKLFVNLPLGGIFLKYPLSLSSAIETRQEGMDMTLRIVYSFNNAMA